MTQSPQKTDFIGEKQNRQKSKVADRDISHNETRDQRNIPTQTMCKHVRYTEMTDF